MLHKYWKTAVMTAASFVGDSPLFLIDYLVRWLRVIVFLSLWRTLLADDAAGSDMSLGAVLTYTLIAEVFREQLAPRTNLESTLWDGSITTRFLQPMGLFGIFTSEMVGRWAFGLCVFSLPLLAVAPWLGVDPRPAGPIVGALFVVSLILATSVGLALEFIFGAIMVYLEHSVYMVNRVRVAITTLLSGSLVPLALLPWGVGELFTWLPFASMASAPLRIFTGTGEAAPLMALQLVWSAVLWPIAHWLWRVNREKLVSYGG